MPLDQPVRWRKRLLIGGFVFLSAVSCVAVAAFRPALFTSLRSHPARDFQTRKVERADLDVTLTAGGRVESSARTIIECGLERLDLTVRGYGYSAGGSTTILKVLPEGSVVKKGEVLCELDSYDYQELLRQQKINIERVQSDYDQAVLNLEVAKISVVEYRDGLMSQTLKDLRGGIALTESEYERSNDRLKWARSMLEKGYVSRGQVTTEEFATNRLALSLRQNRTALALFEKYSAPKYMRVLESDVLAAETVLKFQTLRLQRNKERLQKLESQIDLCTIRAPHDGFLIYVKDETQRVLIEEGATVRQKQKLFYLPDLEKMEVVAQIHESVVERVKPGMTVNVAIEGLPGRRITGRVQSIDPLPIRNDFNDVRNFAGVVKLGKVPNGLRPGMTAEIEIGLTRRSHVLSIPSEALTVESGHDFCYVVHDDHIERRPITVGSANRSQLEVTSGLTEGEEVVVEPSRVDETVETVESVASQTSKPLETAQITH